ncbi:MAG: UbiA family prenyltransferase [Bacteroidota bacterium]
MFKRLFHFFVYSNLFIAGCAVAMVDQTYRLILHSPVNTYFLLFVLSSTICSYSFHWYLTSHSVIPSPRLKWIERNRNIHLLFFILGLAGSAILFFYLLPYWHWLLLSALITFLYSAPKIPHRLFRSLRKVALGKTIFLALVWMNVTTLLPILISGQAWKDDFSLFIISRFFLIYAICILFDYRDRQDDKEAGIRSLITYLDEKWIFRLFVFSLVVFAASTGLLYIYDYSLLSILILLVPGIFTAALYNYARKNFTDIFYYFILDGLMAFSALLMLIPGI